MCRFGAVVAVVVVFFAPLVHAEVFCANSAVEFSSALFQAEANGEDDVVQIVQGTYDGPFVHSTGEVFGLTVEGGYELGCDGRVVDPANTVLDGLDSTRPLALSSSANTSFTVEGITLQNGSAPSAGGGLSVLTAGGDVTILDVEAMGNLTPIDGGGVFIAGATDVVIDRLGLSDNEADVTGGGLWVDAFDVDANAVMATNNLARQEGGGILFARGGGDAGVHALTNSLLADNTGGGGGGLSTLAFTQIQDLRLVGNTFLGNSGDGGGGGGGRGGGARLSSAGTCLVEDNLFLDNSASGGGGFRFQDNDGDLTAVGNTIRENRATDGNGGGVLVDDALASIVLENNDISGNFGNNGAGVSVRFSPTVTLVSNAIYGNVNETGDGGGVRIRDVDTATLTGNTITANTTTTGSGGGVHLTLFQNSDLGFFYNNVVWGNTAGGEANDLWLDNDGNLDVLRSDVELFNNDFDQSADGFFVRVFIPLDASNFDDVDPDFLILADGNVRLGPQSPLIDVGTNGAPQISDLDLDSNPRIVDGDDDGSKVVDLGAYEFDAADLVLTASGACPGAVTLEVEGANPNATVFFAGSFVLDPSLIPGGPCQGAPLDLGAPALLLEPQTAGEDGRVTISGNPPSRLCGLFVQVVDGSNCARSGALPLPSP